MNRRIAMVWILLGLARGIASANDVPLGNDALPSARFALEPRSHVAEPARFALQSSSTDPKQTMQRFRLLGGKAANGSDACDADLLFGNGFE